MQDHSIFPKNLFCPSLGTSYWYKKEQTWNKQEWYKQEKLIQSTYGKKSVGK